MNRKTTKATIIEVGELDFQAEILKSNQPVVVAFLAAWSRPCHVLDSALEAVAIACAGKAKVVKVNADDHPDLSLSYDIQSIPSLLFFNAGILRARLVGTASPEAILSKLELACGGDSHSSTLEPNKQ